jgi:hypothetical protein
MRRLLIAYFSAFVLLCLPTFVWAQPTGSAASTGAAANGSITGAVITSNGVPIGNADVSLEGSQSRSKVRTAADGSFTITGVAPGIYSIVVTRSGFDTARQTDIAVVDGSTVNVKVSLVQASFSSLRVIGSVSTNSGARSQINTSTSSVSTISRQTFLDQAQPQIATILNQTPGIVTTHLEQNGASQGSDEEVQIRGGLPYETESLIDGHPLSIGASGNYNPILLSPGILQDVEVVKGPGSFPTEINGAINGTVNYRTLEPTRTPEQSMTIGSDQYGGVTTTLQATGSLRNHFIDYAFAYATNGTPGAFLNYPAASSTTTFDYLGGAPYSINGRQIAQPTTVFVGSTTPQYIGYPGEIKLAQPLYFCCSPLNLGFHQTNELAKLRFNLTQQTALTVSYLGGADAFDDSGSTLQFFTGGGINFFNFVPPAGYKGSIPAGTQAYFDDSAGVVSPAASNTGLFQAELRSAIGNVTFLGRYYSSFEKDLVLQPGNDTTNLNAWGGVLVCPVGDTAVQASGKIAAGCTLPSGAAGPAPTLSLYNDTPVTIGGTGGDPYNNLDTDHSRGESFQLNLPSGENDYSVSFDRSNHDSTDFLNSPLDAIDSYQLAPGSGQQFTTYAAKAQLAIAKGLSATLGDYFINYKSHFSGDSGVTFGDSSRSYNAPRLALVDRLNTNTSIRLSTGASIAPPYVSLLSAPSGAPVPNIAAAPNYYTQNVNNGQILPETSFGYDVGIDRRLAPRITLSGDIYLTNVRNSFLSETFQKGTYTATSGAAIGQTEPLYVTQTSNLGQSRYEGIEAAVVSTPISGFGYKIQGALIRAYPYDIPNSLYATSSGPYTTNLAVIPNVNYQPYSGIGFNGVGGTGGRVPYSQGYAEVNYRKKLWYGNLGLTYFGPNNTYNDPAFGVMSATIRYSLTKRGSIQLSGYNLTQAYAAPYYEFFAGTPVPLVNGSHGATSGYLGTTEAGNVGPATFRILLTQALGR